MLNKSYKINFEKFTKNFSLPKQIIDEDFDRLDTIFLKVILLIFKNPEKNYSEILLSNLLNCKQEKIASAIDYWVKKRILIQQDFKVIAKEVVKDVNVFSKSIPDKIVQPSSYNEISFLLERMESIFARPITSQERQTVTEILEFVKLPADVILMAIDYCVSVEKASPKFIKMLCINWAEKGIVTHELAEQFLSLLKEKKIGEEKIKTAFGLENKKLNDTERECVNRWLCEFKYDLNTILLAYDKTIAAIGKPAFAYINKILLSWKESNYKTYEEVLKNEGGSLAMKSNSTASYDIDELDSFWNNVPKLD